jgi:hypothetical protein
MAEHYEAEVNKGSLNMGHMTREMNDRYEKGWKLAHIFEHGGDTILVWEKYK